MRLKSQEKKRVLLTDVQQRKRTSKEGLLKKAIKYFEQLEKPLSPSTRNKYPPKRLTPGKTLHTYCRYCIQDNSDRRIQACGGDHCLATGKVCPFFEYRKNGRPPVRVFKIFCRECMGGHADFVLDCESFDCLIYPFRLGSNPARSGIGGKSKKGF